MIKFLIKTIIFSTILFLLVLFSGKLFLNKENVQSFRSKEYNNLKGDIDVAFFGSSHAFSSYDPRVIENELDVSSYNYGVAAQNLNTTKAIIKQEIQKRNIKLGIIDLFWETLREPPFSPRISNFQMQSIDYMDFSINKIELFNSIFGKDSILNIFPTFRNHVLWRERIFQPEYHLKSDIDYYKGFKPPLYFNKKVWENLVKEEEVTGIVYKLESKYKLTDGQKATIDEIIELFKKENVPLLFVNAPIHKKYIDNKYFNYQHLIKEYLKEKKAHYIDFNDFSDDLDLHLFDYKDESHLNTNGALKVTQHLVTFIKKHYKSVLGTSNKRINDNVNRYTILEKSGNDILAEKKIENIDIIKETGVESIFVYKDKYERIEILLIGEYLKDISIKVEYDLSRHSERTAAKEVKRNIKNGKFAIKENLPNFKKEGLYSGYNYKGKEFKVLIVDCPFKEINNFKISIGKTKPKSNVIKLERLIFK